MIQRNGFEMDDHADDHEDGQGDRYEQMVNCIIRSAETGAIHCPLLVQLVKIYRESEGQDGVEEAFSLAMVSHFAEHIYTGSLQRYYVTLRDAGIESHTDIFAADNELANKSAWNLLRDSSYESAEVRRYDSDGNVSLSFSAYDPSQLN